MSDEIRAAAGVILDYVADIEKQGDRLAPSTEAAKILADAYLSEHPADEHEPIDEAFLSSLGFCDCEDESIFMGFDLEWAWLEVKTFPGCPEWHLGGTRMGHDAKTRGDVRRLLAALGITQERTK